MTKPNGKPPIDRAAQDVEALSPGSAHGTGDMPMPTVENEPASVFQPGPGIGSADVTEILLMFLLYLTNSPITVAPGTLRAIPLPADRVAQLSESARRFMAPLQTAPTPH